MADGFEFGRNNDFGTAAASSGFYSGTPGILGSDDSGFDPSDQVTAIVQGWQDGAFSNHGFRIILSDRAFCGTAFADTDNAGTSNQNEKLQLIIVVQQDPPEHFDSDGDQLMDEWEVAVFGSITNVVGTGDADGDSVINLLEQTFGSDAKDSGSKPPFGFDASETGEPILHYLRHQRAGLGYEVLASEDLVDWRPYIEFFDTVTVSDAGNGYDRVELSTTQPLPDRLFVKIAIHMFD